MEEATNSDSNDQFTDADLKEMLHVIAQQTSNALNEADVSVKKYLEIVWDRTDIEAFSKSWQYRQQNWLYPDGKKLDELFHDGDTVDMKSVDEEKLSVYANITKLLVDADNRFQRLIIGFHKIISKQEDLKSRRLTDNRVIDLFSMSLKNLIMVRREVLTLSDKLRLKRTDISENVMSDEDLSDDLFDWIILREYVNQLKYLKKSIDILSFNKVYLQSNFL